MNKPVITVESEEILRIAGYMGKDLDNRVTVNYSNKVTHCFKEFMEDITLKVTTTDMLGTSCEITNHIEETLLDTNIECPAHSIRRVVKTVETTRETILDTGKINGFLLPVPSDKPLYLTKLIKERSTSPVDYVYTDVITYMYFPNVK